MALLYPIQFKNKQNRLFKLILREYTQFTNLLKKSKFQEKNKQLCEYINKYVRIFKGNLYSTHSNTNDIRYFKGNSVKFLSAQKLVSYASYVLQHFL